jgi:predicted nucleotidyltransferase/uncharacterized protein (UPF0332 family)
LENENNKEGPYQGPKNKEERAAIAEAFAKEVLKKYGKYVKAVVMMGSVAREEFKPLSDIDVFVVMDDTSMEFSPEMKEKVDEELEHIAESVPGSFITTKNANGEEEKTSLLSVQPTYTLTEFWDYARVAHPIVYNFIKEGIPIYDTGFFGPIKKLLEMGRIPSTREAIENYMEGAPKKIMRAKTVKLLMLAEDAYYAILNTSQAVLMFMGIEPPVPNKAYDDVKKYLVEPGILEPEYAEWLREIIEIRKKIEHKELMDVSGSFVDEWLERSEKYIDKMFSLLNALEMRKKERVLERTQEVLQKAVITALKMLHKMPDDIDNKSVLERIDMPLRDAFKRDFIDTRRVDPYYWDVWNRIEEMKKMSDDKKLDKISEREVNDMREYVRKLIHDLAKSLKMEEENINNIK